MTTEACGSTLALAVDVLHCTLPADHTEPTGEQPQGQPHEDSGHLDQLTGEPWRWWR